MNSFPWNSISKDRLYDASDFRTCFKVFFNNGIFPTGGNQLQVVSKNGMNLTVKKGACLIDGVVADTEDYQVTIEAAHSQLNRIDRVVVRRTESLRKCELTIITGTPASSPTAPSISRNADIYDLCLAEVKVNAGTIDINQTMITDTRLDNRVCGIVTGAIESVDTSTLFDQMQSWFTNKQLELESIVMTWFNNLKTNLDENAAVNLQNQINSLTERVDSLGANKVNVVDYNNDLQNITKAIKDLSGLMGKSFVTPDGFGSELYLGNGFYLCQHITATSFITGKTVNFYASWHRRWKSIFFAPLPMSTNTGRGDYTSGYASVSTWDPNGCTGYVSDVTPGYYTRVYLWYVAIGEVKEGGLLNAK